MLAKSISMLILTVSNLFYHDISSKAFDKKSGVSDWASKLSGNNFPSTPNDSSITGAATQSASSSANDVIITTKTKKEKVRSKPAVHRDGDIFGGNEDEERDAAITSPIKSGQKPSNTVSCVSNFDIILIAMISKDIIKIESVSPLPKRKNGPRGKATVADLPDGARDNKAWTRLFLATLCRYLAFYEDPWVLDDKKFKKLLQSIWDFVYGERVPYKIDIASRAFRLVSPLVLPYI
jgi:hypothetical protein